ncbi:TIGR03086 family protein [Saccharopolyspora kobensis]|uniref:TIGR03086 family protein n=1 Tax=Saccharopolyspora kobensis TaxID=146035 RepID=A0A1H6D4N3_9PSEU|nr:TIGR03086 family metal-binding protein [Saccharopolyspora kobensis]SEG80307.1 TIGR03086 family protein [Saccharopolyspora kobensis]SFD11451.1 TIGR03086 family protein [Saccharopolyspora kobensis]
MSEAQHLNRAASAMVEIVEGVEPGHLTAPTPCTEYAVRDLLNHLLFWGPSLEGAARKETVPPPAPAESDVDLVVGDWKAAVVEQLDRMAQVWSAPGAWSGSTHMGGPDEMPGALVGSMVTIELVVHSWDLGKATGQSPRLDEALLDFAFGEVGKMAEQGRALGAFGAEVPVPDTAPLLDRLVALTGRNPDWTP